MLKVTNLSNVYRNGVLVKQVDSVNYLGHFLTCELSDDIDIRRQCCVLNVRGNILFRKFHTCSVPVKLKLHSYCYWGTCHHVVGGIGLVPDARRPTDHLSPSLIGKLCLQPIVNVPLVSTMNTRVDMNNALR